MTAQKVSWREARGTGWSKTLYSGLKIYTGNRIVIVSRLSHGLRVISMSDESKFDFVYPPSTPVHVSDGFVLLAGVFLMTDEAFQQMTPEYEKMMELSSS